MNINDPTFDRDFQTTVTGQNGNEYRVAATICPADPEVGIPHEYIDDFTLFDMNGDEAEEYIADPHVQIWKALEIYRKREEEI